MKKIFITREIPEPAVSMFKEKGYDVTIGKSKTPLTQDELTDQIRDKNYDAIITLLTDKIDHVIFEATPSTKIFANCAIGFDNIDLIEANTRGITVTNASGDYVDGIAEHTIGIMLALTSKLVEADTFVREGKYTGWDPMLFIGEKIGNKTVAIIGTGKIGMQVAYKLHHGFGVKIIYYDIVRNEKLEKDCDAKFVQSVDGALIEADIVSIHVPLLPSTHHLINKENLAKMKSSAYIINTSRGPVIDEGALVEALQKGIIRGAGLDVYEFEPHLQEGLKELRNTVLSPHIASAQIESREEMSRIVARNVIDFFEGKIPPNKVNK